MENIAALKKIWPDWQVEEKPLGRGSYGTVYKAVRREHDIVSYAAIKAISIPQSDSEIDSLRAEGLSQNDTKNYFEGVVGDFVSEIRLMESFKGVQNIVSVEDFKVVEKEQGIGWDIYIRMELLTPFNKYAADKVLSEQEVIKLGVDMCSALELCAKRSVIHRDIKPENIFVNQFGDFKLGDFGIARKLENATGGLSQKGTFNYMAPEVERGTNYDATVDIYSLGIVLYRLLNKNRLPFMDPEKQLISPADRENALRRRLSGEKLPPPCDASPALADVVLCACEYDPSERFANAGVMKNVLLSISASEKGKKPAANRPVSNVNHAPAQNARANAGMTETVSLGRNIINATDADRTASVNANRNVTGTSYGNYGAGRPVTPPNAARNASNMQPEPAVKQKKEKKKMSKGKKFLIGLVACLVLLLALGITGYSKYKNSDALAVIDMLKDGKYETAVKRYNRDVKGEKLQEMIFNPAISKQYDEKLEDFAAGKIGYEEALDYIDTVMTMDVIGGAEDKFAEVIATRCTNIMNEFNAGTLKFEDAKNELTALSAKETAKLKTNNAAEKLELLKELNTADTAYESATAQIDAGNYEAAINQLSQIPEESNHYSEAQTKLNEAINSYKSSVLEQANAHIAAGNYSRAISVIEYALNIIKDDSELKAKLDATKTQHTDSVRNTALSESTDKQSAGDYLGAMKVLEDAIKQIGSDAQLQAAYDACENSYVTKIKNEVESKLSTDWNAAKTIIDDAVAVLPGNATLTALLQTVNESKPAKLYEMTVVDSDEYKYIKNSLDEDVFTTYGERIEECIDLYSHRYYEDAQGYVIYNISGYNSLELTIAPRQGFESGKIIRVTILLDDEIAYENEFKVTTAAQQIRLNISGHTLIRIQLSNSGNFGDGHIVVYNANLKK